MKKFILLILFFHILIFAKQTKISITADSFEASENQHKSIFDGNVKITKNSDTIKASKAIVEFDKKNKPIKYKALDKVEFFITLKNSTLFGSCNELIFVPKSKVYTLKGKVQIDELPTKRKIQASKVIIDSKVNKINIIGEKNKPVKFIFEVEDK